MTSVFYTVASTLLQFVQTEVAATPAGVPAKARVCLVPGQLAWDDCECGLIAVELVDTGFAKSATLESVPEINDGCRSYATVTYKISLLRCAPMPGSGGAPPTCPALDAAATVMYDDLGALLRGTSLAVKSLDDANVIQAFSFGGATPAGPEGGCVGLTQQVTVGLPNLYGAC